MDNYIVNYGIDTEHESLLNSYLDLYKSYKNLDIKLNGEDGKSGELGELSEQIENLSKKLRVTDTIYLIKNITNMLNKYI